MSIDSVKSTPRSDANGGAPNGLTGERDFASRRNRLAALIGDHDLFGKHCGHPNLNGYRPCIDDGQRLDSGVERRGVGLQRIAARRYVGNSKFAVGGGDSRDGVAEWIDEPYFGPVDPFSARPDQAPDNGALLKLRVESGGKQAHRCADDRCESHAPILLGLRASTNRGDLLNHFTQPQSQDRRKSSRNV